MSNLNTFDSTEVLFRIFARCLARDQPFNVCLEEIPAPVAVLGSPRAADTGQIITSNRAFGQLLDLNEEQVAGRRMLEFFVDPATDAKDSITEKLEQDGFAVVTRNLHRVSGHTVRVERTVMQVPAWPDLDVEGEVLVVMDRVLETIIPAAGGAALSQSQQVTLQVETLFRRYVRENHRQGMHPAQWSALRYFKLAPPETRNLTGFARAHYTTMGTASTTVSTLVNKGYLQKHSFRGAVNLTPAGEALLKDDPLSKVLTSVNRMSAFERNWAEFVLTSLNDSFGDGE